MSAPFHIAFMKFLAFQLIPASSYAAFENIPDDAQQETEFSAMQKKSQRYALASGLVLQTGCACHSDSPRGSHRRQRQSRSLFLFLPFPWPFSLRPCFPPSSSCSSSCLP